MTRRRTLFATLTAVVALATGCTIPVPDAAPTGQPSAAVSVAASPTPKPTPTPTPPPASVAASPGASSLAVLPDARTGAALDVPLVVRGVPLINVNHGVSEAYAPKLDSDHQLTEEAEKAYTAMSAAGKAAGVSILWRVGYRSYQTQKRLSATPPAVYGDDADSYVAKPGHSEHQAGLAVDVASKTGYGTRFPQTKEFAWLRAHSYEYGFILRYPEGKTAITGVNYEPWHYRYVGVAVAAAFGPASNLTLEEYLGGR